MVREILKIYTDNGLGNNNPPFKGIELTDYSAKFYRMGMPSLTATLKWATPLDDEWTRKEYVTLRGERFYIRHTPSGKKDNQDARYNHEIEFTSEFAEILGNTYFVDAVPDANSGIVCITKNKPCTNSTKFTFYGTIREFVDRLNCAFRYAKIGDSKLNTKTSLTTFDSVIGDGYCAMLDPYGDYDPDKSYEFSWEDKSFWEAITEGYSKTEIPFERRGKKIIFGAVPFIVDHKFEYGCDNELLSISKKNANAKVVNRITMLGSSENIPHYYPNETEYGHISIAAKSGNNVLAASMLEIANETQLLSRLREGDWAILRKYEGMHDSNGGKVGAAEVQKYEVAWVYGTLKAYTPGDPIEYNGTDYSTDSFQLRVRVYFKVTEEGDLSCYNIIGGTWIQNSPKPSSGADLLSAVVAERLHCPDNKEIYDKNLPITGDGVSLGYLEKGEYYFQFRIYLNKNLGGQQTAVYAWIDSMKIGYQGTVIDGYKWVVGEKIYDGIGYFGLKFAGGAVINDDMVGDGFGWTASGRMPFQENLIPPKYRNTSGSERFYNALNAPYTEAYASSHQDAYKDPDTKNPYVFPNPYINGSPSEHIFRDEDRKPTIEGIANNVVKGYDDEDRPIYQLLGEIADIAYDSDDNDSLKSDATEDNDKNDSLKYEHSFFYIKLNIFNGTYGFDLFAHASQTDAMTLQMTSGNCNGCKFKIQALEYEDETGLKSYKNPVQTTGSNGVIVSGSYADKVKKDWQEWQQNTQTHSIWICVQKDASTFGVLMPNQSNNFKPAIGDKFNIINIDLPKAYILAAEKRLEEDGMRFMADNNEDKFTFDIQVSRIFFASRPDVLAQIDEYSKIKVTYNGKEYEQYVNQLSIDCKDSEALPNIGIDLTDTLAVGQSFIDQVAERASSLVATPSTLGGNLGSGGGGISAALAERRYLNKMKSDRTPYKISTDSAFEVGDFVSGASGGIFFRDPETGNTWIEADYMKIRMKAIFEELEIAKVSTIGGKFVITPGGGIHISFVEELTNSYRCYFKAKEEDKGAECRFVVGDQVQCHEFNVQPGVYHNASNRYYWRLVTAVNNDKSYIELSKTDRDNANGLMSDAPMAGDTVVQLGNRNDNKRQSAIILSTVDAFAPCVTLFNGINSYSLDGKAVVEYGVDKTKNPPRPFFHCYGDMYIGNKDGTRYLRYTPEGGLIVRGSISSVSTIVDEYGNEVQIEKYVDDAAQSAADAAKNELQGKIAELQNQVDGVVEAWSFPYPPTTSNYPANQWTTEGEKNAHVGDVFYNIQPAYNADGTANPDAGKAWRWSQNDSEHSGYHWHPIADSDAVRALQLAQMSVTDTDVLFKQHTSPTDTPELPVVNASGTITNLNGWSTDAPEWEAGKYIWQTTYVKKGDGSAAFSNPTCISGRNGVDGTSISITSKSVKYSTNHGATQPADSTFTLNSVPTNLNAGDYLWSKTTVIYSNTDKTESYAVSRIGTNGTSVTITSTSVTYAKTSTVTQPSDSAFTYASIGEVGLSAGDYLWTKTEVTYSDGTPTKSYTVSRIGSDGDDGLPGTPGADGQTPYVHFAYASGITGNLPHPTAIIGFSTTSFAGAKYIGVCTDYNEADPTTNEANVYEWSEFKGEDGSNAKAVVVNADGQAFVYKDDFATLVGPSSIALSATLQNTTGYQWSYKKAGAATFTNISGGTSATLSVAATDTTYFPSGARSCVFRCSSGGMYDEVTLIKVSSGSKGIDGSDGYTVILTNESHTFLGDSVKAEPAYVNCGIIVYKGNVQVQDVQIVGVTGLPSDGMTVQNYANGKGFTVSVNSNLTKSVGLSGVLDVEFTADGMTFNRKFSWVLSLAGRGVKNVTEQYAIHSSGTTPPPDADFSPNIPQMTDAKPFLWNREVTSYTDNTADSPTTPVCIGVKGQNGDPGATVVSVTNYYLASDKSSGVTKDDTGWANDPVSEPATVSSSKPYLWNYEVTKWSKGADTSTEPHIVGQHGSSYTDNLIIHSNPDKTTDAYLVGKFKTAVDLKPGVAYTCTIWGELGAGKTQFDLKVNGGNKDIVWGIRKVAEGKYSAQGKIAEGTVLQNAREVLLYQMPQGEASDSRIDRIKLEEGVNPNPQWTPNSLEMIAPTITEQYYLSSSNFELQDGEWKDAEHKDAWKAGWFVWTRSEISYATGEVEYTEPVCVTGATGAAGTSVLAQYSATGGPNESEWHPMYQAGDVWMRTSDDGGNTWSTAIQMQGASYAPNLLLGTRGWTFEKSSTSAINEFKQFATVKNLKDLPAGTKLTISYDYEYSNVTTGEGFGVQRFGVYIPIKQMSGYQKYLEAWVYLEENSTGLSGSGRCSAIVEIPANADINVNYVRMGAQLASGNIKLGNLMIEEGTNDNPQWVPAASEMVGQDGKWRKFQWGVTTSSTSASGIAESDWKDTPMTANPGYYVWMRSGMVVPPATNPTTWETATRLTGDKGQGGDSVYQLDLSDEMMPMPCDAAGNVVSAYLTSQASVYKGGSKVTSGITYSIAQQTGVSATITSAGLVTPSNLTADRGTIVVQAVVSGITLQTTLSLYKVKPGANFSPNLITGTADGLLTPLYGVATQAWAQYKPVPFAEDVELAVGEKIAISVESIEQLKGSATSYSVGLYGVQTSGQLGQSLATMIDMSPEELSCVLTVNAACPEDQTPMLLIYPGKNGQLNGCYARYNKLMVVKGSTPMPWSPAASEVYATVYSLQTSVQEITRSPDGELSATSITVNIFKTIGNNPPVKANSEGFIRYQFVHENGASTEAPLPVDGNGGFEPIVIPETRKKAIRGIIVYLYPDSMSTEWLDRERIPVASDVDEMRISSRNLLIGSKEFTVTAASDENYAFKSFSLPIPLKAGDYVALNIEEIILNAGSATQYTADLFNKNWSASIIPSPKQLTASSRTAVFKITKDEDEPKFLLYAGVKGSTAGNKVTYRKAILTLGNVPMQSWQKAPEDFDYLTTALAENSADSGGLALRALLKLGQGITTDSNGKVSIAKVRSGMNGIIPDGLSDEQMAKIIAVWYGGDMVDRYYYTETGAKRDVPLASGFANGLFRMDGTGYLAGGLIEFLANAIRLANGKLVLDANGLHLVNASGKNVLEVTQESISQAYGGGDFLNSTTMTINSGAAITHYWAEIMDGGLIEGSSSSISYRYNGSTYVEVQVAKKTSSGAIERFPYFKPGTKIRAVIPSLASQAAGLPTSLKLSGVYCSLSLIKNSNSAVVDGASYPVATKGTSIEHEFVVEEYGQYRLGINYGTGSGSKSATGNLTLGGKVYMTIDEGTRLAPDGFVSAWGQTAVKFASDGIFLRHQLAGMKLTSDGIHYMTDGENWKPLT